MQLIAHTVTLLVGCGLAAAAVPPATLLDKRHDQTYCHSNCLLAGIPLPDQDTIQLPLENYLSEQCPPTVATIGTSTVTSRACISFPGTSMDFTFASFPGYNIKWATVTWKVKGNVDGPPSSWALAPPAPPTYSATCYPNAAGVTVCSVPFSTIFPYAENKQCVLLGKMCPNGDKEALIFYLEFSGKIQSVNGGDYITFKQQYPCAARSNRDCTALNYSKNFIEVAYRCSKCDVSPCPISAPTV